jgi:protein phosphatase
MLQCNDTLKPLQKIDIQQQLKQVQISLNKLLIEEPELEKMGTTFTGVFRTPDFWYAAHIGDSRVYLFRPSEQKLWHTWDHSFVGELMRTHEITVEAGRFHPMSNRIAKAIIAQKEDKIVTASIVKIDELKKGDILLLCSDGLVEAWGDWELVQLFADNTLGFEQKCEILARQCNDKSKDNNTAIIAEIEDKDAFSYGSNSELDWTSFEEAEADYKQYLRDIEPAELVDAEWQENKSAMEKLQNEQPIEADQTSEDFSEAKPQRIGNVRYWVIGLITMLCVFLAVSRFYQSDNTQSDAQSQKENRSSQKGTKDDKQQDTSKKDNTTEMVGETAKSENATNNARTDGKEEESNNTAPSEKIDNESEERGSDGNQQERSEATNQDEKVKNDSIASPPGGELKKW